MHYVNYLFGWTNLERPFVYEGKNLKVTVPKHPLAPRSVVVIPTGEDRDYKEEYDTFQKIAQITQGPYMIYSKESLQKPSLKWEFVPYPKTGWWLWNQIKVLWNISFGGWMTPVVTRQQVAKSYKDAFEQNPSAKQTAKKTEKIAYDVFCDPEKIKRQLIVEGKKVNILYDVAPIAIGKEKLHFLIITKEHRATFEELTQEEYKEVQEFGESLTDFYAKKGYQTVYRFNKNGHDAAERKQVGQTVPHWHEHFVVTATKTEEWFGKWMVLKGMLWGKKILSDQEFESRVTALRKELN